MVADKLYQLALTLVPGIGHVLVKNLVSYAGSAEQVFGLSKARLLKIPGIGDKTASEIRRQTVMAEAEKQLLLAEKEDVNLLFYTDKEYPNRLKQIYDAPSLIYFRGTADLNHTRILSIVGSRKATGYGKSFVQHLLKEIKSSNIIIVSGLAYGIDIAAHKAALAEDIPTIGVLASGIDIIYPDLHRKYAQAMLANGGLLSEYPIGTTPDPARFPARNRIIAGLSDATLVVEAAAKGGALITADLAADYDREVFALPGNVNHETSAGCNNLIKKNIAQLITSPEDLSFYLQWEQSAVGVESKKSFIEDEFSTEEWAVISTLLDNGQSLHIDEISWRSQTQISQLASILLSLEFKGLIDSLPGKKFALK